MKILVVEDEAPIRRNLERLLTLEGHEVLSAENGGVGFDLACRTAPELIFSDVMMPELNGYELCRRIKANPDTAAIPVVFVSGYDDIEARLTGYDAGGEDFIVKPFQTEELLRKVAVAQRILESKRSLAARAGQAERTALTALSGMGELGIVLEFLRRSFVCTDIRELANAALQAIKAHGLDGAIQVRMPTETLNLSPNGENLPLETSVLNHVSQMGRLFEFKHRAAFNFGGVTLLAKDMPGDDDDRRGRLRDNLALLAEGTDARRQVLEIELANRATQQGILAAVETTRDVIAGLCENQRHNHDHLMERMAHMQQDLAREFVGLGLHEHQEERLADLIKRQMAEVVQELDASRDIGAQLEMLSFTLGHLAHR